ncbi:MAG: flagellar hook-associated protein FlgK [Candidatus Solibacter sp.]
MSNLLASLLSTAGTLDAYGRVLEVAQNNVANASTAGYAKQRLDLHALPFDPAGGVTGGVRAGSVVSARSEYAELAVRRQTSALGYDTQLVDSLTSIQSNFDISGNQGIPQALNNLLQSFSAWGAIPDNQSARQTVIERASDLAYNFQRTSHDIFARARDTELQVGRTVAQVNQTVAELQGYNQLAMQGNNHDSGLDARMHAALEELSSLVDVDATFQNDGTVNLMLNGESPLLLGDRAFALNASLYQPQEPVPVNPSGPAVMRVIASDGSDVTSKTTGGQLGALLKLRNQILPEIMGDSTQAGSLNVMAKQFADRVNELLTSGNITNGPPAEAGVPLFTYDTTDATAVARTLSVNPDLTAEQLASISTGPPEVSNGVPLALSAMANPLQDADKVNGLSFSQFFGEMAARVGSLLRDGQNNQDVQQSLLSQAKDLRQQYQGVSLDEEATILMQFQRAYQATSKFLSVLDQLTETTINILR